MLYKVTPMLPSAATKLKEPGTAGRRSRRRSAVFNDDGQEVLITLMCLKCHRVKPLVQFGLRKMADGAIRNQPWCRACRSVAGASRDAPEPSPPGCNASAAALREAEQRIDSPLNASLPQDGPSAA